MMLHASRLITDGQRLLVPVGRRGSIGVICAADRAAEPQGSACRAEALSRGAAEMIEGIRYRAAAADRVGGIEFRRGAAAPAGRRYRDRITLGALDLHIRRNRGARRSRN